MTTGEQVSVRHKVSVESLDRPSNRRKIWLAIGGCFFMMCLSSGLVAAFGVFQDFYTKSWLDNYSPSQISWIGGAQFLIESGLPRLLQKLLPHDFFIQHAICGNVMLVLSFFALSMCKKNVYYQVFLAQGIGMGIGMGLLSYTTSVALSRLLVSQKVRNIVILGLPIGGLLYSIILNNLLNGLIDFTWVIQISACITLGGLIIANLLILISIRDIEAAANDIESGQDQNQDQEKVEEEPSTPSDTGQEPRPRMTHIVFALTLVAGFILICCSCLNSFYIQLFVRYHDIHAMLTSFAVPLLNFMNCTGRIAANYAIDRKLLKPSTVLTICAVLGCLSILSKYAANHPIGLVLVSILSGLFAGGGVTAYLIVTRSIVDRRQDYAYFLFCIANLVGASALSAPLGRNYAWKISTTVSLIAMLVSSSCGALVNALH